MNNGIYHILPYGSFVHYFFSVANTADRYCYIKNQLPITRFCLARVLLINCALSSVYVLQRHLLLWEGSALFKESQGINMPSWAPSQPLYYSKCLSSPQKSKEPRRGNGGEYKNSYICIVALMLTQHRGLRQGEVQDPISTKGSLIFHAHTCMLLLLIPLLKVQNQE